jgi:hypothetical protein
MLGIKYVFNDKQKLTKIVLNFFFKLKINYEEEIE